MVKETQRYPLLRAAVRPVSFVVSVGLMIGGGYAGWVLPGQTETGKLCGDLRVQVLTLRDSLIAKGTLGWGDGAFSGVEVRNLKDVDSLELWGSKRNDRDKVCALADKEDRGSWGWGRIVAALGFLGAVVSLQSRRTKKDFIRN